MGSIQGFKVDLLVDVQTRSKVYWCPRKEDSSSFLTGQQETCSTGFLLLLTSLLFRFSVREEV